MRLAAPAFLLLLLIPLAAAALDWWRGRRQAARPLPAVLRALIRGNRVQVREPDDGDAMHAWRSWLALAAVAIALARPQWGLAERSGPVPGQLVIALDLSRSMLAEDAVPSRLERARTLAGQLVDARPGDRIGLIGFAGDAHLLAPPSSDRAVLRAFLPAIGPEHMARPGTNFARLIALAAAAFDAQAPGPRTLVILSDGEAAPDGWQARLGLLSRGGIRVVAAGIGTAAGAPLRQGGKPILAPSGRPVVSHLQSAALRAFAAATGGAYLGAARDGDLAAAVAATPIASADHGRAAAPERFRLFLGVALLLLGWSIAVEWPALPRLHLRARPVPARGFAAVAVLLALLPFVPAAGVRRIDPELHGMEPDPLLVMKQVVARMVAKRSPDAGDYQRLADTAVRYGEVHRGHAHPLELGVLRDGLAAVAAGRGLDPGREAWEFDRKRLVRLLQPPKPPADLGGKPGDPADDPADVPGARQAEQDRQKLPSGDADRDRRDVGGGKRDVYDRAEWRIPSLVRPLSLMQRVRAQDSPAELFRAMQPAPRPGIGPDAQTW